ncbi:hypothetical protein FOL47_008856 [Perkinsus chesapeaki]|uniref:Niemann-Pick C1 N-terminal domain-containing protein n=1 Tax=Perkinsus chesapeaki TaxID=330153 RepID=A0A7J6MT95_PERCH|nr:hypothetical protein FOL47_008856 [Perkinsus chesapeaki]
MRVTALLTALTVVQALDGLDDSGLASRSHHQTWVSEGWAQITDESISLVQLDASAPLDPIDLEESVSLVKSVAEHSPHSPPRCPLTGGIPSDRPVGPGKVSDGPCSFWTKGVCCTDRQLIAVDEVLTHALAFVQDAPSSKLGQCPGCRENMQALLCGVVCSPDIIEPVPNGGHEVVLPTAFCAAFQGSCGTSAGGKDDHTCEIGLEAKTIVETLLSRVTLSEAQLTSVSINHNKKHSILAVSTICEREDAVGKPAASNEGSALSKESAGEQLNQHTGGAPDKHTHDEAARRGRTLAAMMSESARFVASRINGT